MLENYLIIHKSILPDYFDKILEAKQMVETGRAKDVSAAVKQVGISRSTYYKYKDYIMQPSEISSGRNAVLAFMLTHEAGILSAVLSAISETGASVLTITQSLPIHGLASVTVSLDTSQMQCTIEEMLARLENQPGVKKPKLIAIE